MINDLPLRLLTQDPESGQASGSKKKNIEECKNLLPYINFNTVTKDNSNSFIYFCIFNSKLKNDW